MNVYRVWGKNVTDFVWLLAESEADAIEVISKMKILHNPLRAVPDGKKLGVTKGLVLNVDGETFTIARG